MNFSIRKTSRRRGATWAAFLALTALGLSGCASSGDNKEIDVSELAAGTTEFQSAILEDGVVSAAEYERAVLAQQQCVADTGAKVGELYEIANNQITFDFEVEADTQAEVDDINEKAFACQTEYLDAVGLVWSEQNILTPDEKEKLRPQVVACLQEADIPVDDDASYDEIMKALEGAGGADQSSPAAGRCVSEYSEYFMVSITDVPE